MDDPSSDPEPLVTRGQHDLNQVEKKALSGATIERGRKIARTPIPIARSSRS
jgi:hypothetical protein